MKKYFLFAIVLLVSVAFYSCGSDTSTNPETPAAKGSIYITSNPSGAQIWNNNTNTNKVTPDSITGLDAGNYSITLKYQGLRDTTISVTVNAGQKVPLFVKMPLSVKAFGPVRVWETFGTSASQPSGLQLSTGQAYGISSADKDKVDLYYHSLTTPPYEIASASLASGLTRTTYFLVGNSTNLNDTTTAPVKSGSWVKTVKDTETNYIYVYDQDQHYSKLKFTTGGGTPGQPAYIDVTWFYNQVPNDRRFQ